MEKLIIKWLWGAKIKAAIVTVENKNDSRQKVFYLKGKTELIGTEGTKVRDSCGKAR